MKFIYNDNNLAHLCNVTDKEYTHIAFSTMKDRTSIESTKNEAKEIIIKIYELN